MKVLCGSPTGTIRVYVMRVGMRCCGQNDRSEFHCVGGEMIKYEIIDLHKIAIIGKEGLCTKEKNVPIPILVILRISG